MGRVLHVAINTEVDRAVILWIRRGPVFYFTGLANSTTTHLMYNPLYSLAIGNFILLVELEVQLLCCFSEVRPEEMAQLGYQGIQAGHSLTHLTPLPQWMM